VLPQSSGAASTSQQADDVIAKTPVKPKVCVLPVCNLLCLQMVCLFAICYACRWFLLYLPECVICSLPSPILCILHGVLSFAYLCSFLPTQLTWLGIKQPLLAWNPQRRYIALTLYQSTVILICYLHCFPFSISNTYVWSHTNNPWPSACRSILRLSLLSLSSVSHNCSQTADAFFMSRSTTSDDGMVARFSLLTRCAAQWPICLEGWGTGH
jgi:hypothetical protein